MTASIPLLLDVPNRSRRAGAIKQIGWCLQEGNVTGLLLYISCIKKKKKKLVRAGPILGTTWMSKCSMMQTCIPVVSDVRINHMLLFVSIYCER
jgi:hypothetical protein